MHYLKVLKKSHHYILERSKRNNGFTLIEVLASIALFTLVAVLGMTLVVGAQGSQKQIETGLTLQRSTNLLLMDLRQQYAEQVEAAPDTNAPIALAVNPSENIKVTELIVNGQDISQEPTVIRDITAGESVRISLTTEDLSHTTVETEENRENYVGPQTLSIDTVFNTAMTNNTSMALTPVSDFEWEYTDETETAVRILKYTGSSTSVGIPNTIKDTPVTEIGDSSFSTYIETPTGPRPDPDAILIENVKIPNTVTHIGNAAFLGNSITNIDLPDNLEHIGSYGLAFNALTTIDIPDSVTYIEGLAFMSNKLKDVTLPTGINTLKVATFDGNEIENITIPPNVKNIDGIVFSGNNLKNITIPNTVETVAISAFINNNFGTITIQGPNTNINKWHPGVNDRQNITVRVPKNSSAFDDITKLNKDGSGNINIVEY